MAQALGRAGQVTITGGNDAVEIVGIVKFLREASKADERFDVEMRKASRQVAANIIIKAKAEAATVTRSRQAIQVMRGMKARSDRIPTASLSHKSPFISKSNPSKNRKRPVTRGDVFFGAEFGGQASPRTKQFLRHRGRSGYFFWPTVRKEKENIAKEYLDAIQKVLNTLNDRS
jgi:DNA polymerase II small subunit/DNA polymerase delta subunit B